MIEVIALMKLFVEEELVDSMLQYIM